ncbi:MAG: hypothetical protein ACI9OJ_002499 [Myxococcota bacterium]|jgi:hypothetical protein
MSAPVRTRERTIVLTRWHPIVNCGSVRDSNPIRRSYLTRWRHSGFPLSRLSSASPLRPYAVRSPPEPTPQRPTAPVRPRRMRRADLLARVFGFKVLACPCGGSFRPIAVITQRSRHPGHPGRHGPVKLHLRASPTPPVHPRQLTPDTANGPTAAPACGDVPVRDSSPNHT